MSGGERRRLTPKGRAVVAELAYLLPLDRNVPEILKRLGTTATAAERYCMDAGRRDLASLVRVYGGLTNSQGDPYSESTQSFYLRADGDPWKEITGQRPRRQTWKGGRE